MKHIYKIEIKNFIAISDFDYENKKNIQSMCQKAFFFEEKYSGLLLIGEQSQKHYGFNKDFHTFT